VSNASLRALAAGCPRLRSLAVAHCNRIGDDGLIALAEGCRLLRDIDLFGCTVSQVGLEALCSSLYDIRCMLTAYS
jgi:hypothetical protein